MASSAPFQQDRTAYQEYQDRLSPTALQGPVGTAFESAFGAMKDAQLARLVASVKAKFPGLAPADALAAIGVERGMPRGGSESDAAYAARLLDAWNTWPFAGTAFGLLRAFYGTGYQNVVLAQVRGGKQFTLDNGGTNLLRWSTNMTLSPWIPDVAGTGSAPVITPNFAAAPDGTITAARLQLNRGAGTTVNDRSRWLNGSVTASTTLPSCFAVWLKSNTGSSQLVAIEVGSALRQLVTVTSSWQQFFVVGQLTVSPGQAALISTRGTYGTDQVIDILVAYPQLETGSAPGPYASTYNVTKTTAQAAGTLLTAAPANALWETDPLSSYSPVNQAFWSKFDVLFPLPLQSPGFSWAGGIPSSSSTEANFIRALIQAWKPAHATCNRIVIQQAGKLLGYPATATLGSSNGTIGSAVSTVWTP